jgi:DNA-binding response OmpR family regulator
MTRRILLVEDDADTRHAIAVRLRSAGYEVIVAGDGHSAVVHAQKDRPDLILLDLGLPGGDGFSVMKRLDALGLRAVAPVIVLTARAGSDDTQRALAAGAVLVLHKPVDNEQLLAAIAANVAQSPATVAGEPSAPRPRILVIEDDPDTQLGLKVRLQASGFDVSQASDGSTAMTRVRKERPDVILLDLGLPGGDGLAVLERLKRNAETEPIPVVVLSARDPVVNAPKALSLGAAAFLQKPPDNAELLRELQKALGRT